MKKIALFLLIITFPSLLWAQKTITVVSNIKVTYDQNRGSFRWYRPVFAHEGSTLAADSSDFNEGDNYFDAYGHVVITQPNGTVVYADKLHYTESNQQALLTGNVRMVDQQATLTTDYLTYNLRTKVGSYYGGGTIINGTDTLTSDKGFYFENSQDAYFREDVIVQSKGALILTDSMRYNTASKMTYFYGPTNIKSDNGNLYTENGDYNTESEQARFGKNNLYTEGSKFFRGDSLYYDGLTGNGRAVKNVVFVDTAQQTVMYSQLGTYDKATQTTLMTQNAYIVLATDDSTNNDSTSNNSDTLNLAVDTVTMSQEENSLLETDVGQNPSDTSQSATNGSIDLPESNKKDSTYMTADTLISRVIPLKDFIPLNLKLGKEDDTLEEEVEEYEQMDYGEGNSIISRQPDDADSLDFVEDEADSTRSIIGRDSSKTILSTDSLVGDTTQVDSVKKQLAAPVAASDSLRIDSLEKGLNTDSAAVDSTLGKKDLSRSERRAIRKLERQKEKEAKRLKKAAADSIKQAEKNQEKSSTIDSIKAQITDLQPTDSLGLADSTAMTIDSLVALDSSLNAPALSTADSILNDATERALSGRTDSLQTDTAETRVVLAFHNVKIFKSDLQAIADSAYYSYADSIIRCYGDPLIWSQGSQLTADSVYMLLKDQRMENVLFDRNAFIVNTELDSTKFNQIKGRKITGYFENGELDRIYVDGNAESIYYTVEDSIRTGMLRSLSSRIKVNFENQQMSTVTSIRKVENVYYPIGMIPRDLEILEGFIWKPELRPKSKEEIIPTENLNKEATPTTDDDEGENPMMTPDTERKMEEADEQMEILLEGEEQTGSEPLKTEEGEKPAEPENSNTQSENQNN
ncbi:OstA-like protein [Albibacterium indicum]|uniref:OstA-like protein n=1 Tax=Albibacterium indicum TaxID=2292082 RepID=UPI001300549C|nr:OstA-like protein [Pedobacter indicus]